MAESTQNSQGQYYYADDEKVELRPSGHFVALRTEEGQTATEAAASIASAATTDTQRPVQVRELEEYDRVVVDLPEDMRDGPAAAGETLAAAPGAAGPGPTV